jgi:hypothetical protein
MSFLKTSQLAVDLIQGTLRRRRHRKMLEQLRGAFRGAEVAASFIAAPSKPADDADAQNPLRAYFDAHDSGPGIWKWLHYFDVYDRHFRKFVGKEVHIAEVGVFSGGSLELWHQYFGPKCHVYGIDLEPACRAYESENTKIFIGDQADRSFWKRFRDSVPPLDIIIDDGGHLPEQQMVTLEETLPYLRNGGVYLCEDIHGVDNRFASYAHAFANSLNQSNWTSNPPGERERLACRPSPLQEAIASVHFYPFLTVIERTLRPVNELAAPPHGTTWQPIPGR